MSRLASVARREDALLVVVDVQQRLAAAMERRDAVAASVVRLVKTAALVGVPIVVTRQYPGGSRRYRPHGRARHRGGRSRRSLGHARRQARVRLLLGPRIRRHRLEQRSFAARARRDGDAYLHRPDGLARPAVRSRGADRGGSMLFARRRARTRWRFERMRAAGAVVSSVESVMYELVGAAGTDEFRSLLRIVKE